jgi:hypothetical protein
MWAKKGGFSKACSWLLKSAAIQRAKVAISVEWVIILK